MPLVFNKTIGTAKKAAVWEITEPYVFFEEQLQGHLSAHPNPRRRMEHAACCHLLNCLFGKRVHHLLDKDVFGKPFINNTRAQVSFSHSGNYVACLLDTGNGKTGIDIERIRENISVLAGKFVADSDTCPIQGDTGLQLIWGAKEVLYKIDGKKGLDFKQHLATHFDTGFAGIIRRNGQSETYQLDYDLSISGYVLVWNV